MSGSHGSSRTSRGNAALLTGFLREARQFILWTDKSPCKAAGRTVGDDVVYRPATDVEVLSDLLRRWFSGHQDRPSIRYRCPLLSRRVSNTPHNLQKAPKITLNFIIIGDLIERSIIRRQINLKLCMKARKRRRIELDIWVQK